MPTTVEKIIAKASAEIGYREKRSGGHFNNDTRFADEVPGLEWADFQPWCATFVSWVAMKSRVPDLYPRTASCDTAGLWFKARKRWSEFPAIGAQVFYGSPKDLNHTGIVIDFDDDNITTVEGNTNNTGSREGNGVYKKVRARRDDFVVGYGYPLFPDGITSADPEFGGGDAASPRAPRKGIRVDGVDISHWQDQRLDFVTARDAGLKFVVHKTTDGVAFVDEKYDVRRGQVAEAGLVWGGYHFARPEKSSGAKQAQFFLSRLLPVSGDVLPVLDLEKDGGLGRAELGAWTKDFVAEVKMRLGVLPIIYTPFDLPNTGCPLWVARYSNTNMAPRIPKPWKKYAMWQFSNGEFGRPNEVPGVGHCDLDTLGTGVRLSSLRIPGQGVKVPKPRAAETPVARALATNREHVEALQSLQLPEARPIAEQALVALELERLALEMLGKAAGKRQATGKAKAAAGKG